MIKKYWKLILLSCLLFVFVVVTREVLEEELLKFDVIVYNFISSFREEYLTCFFKVVTSFSSSFFLAIMSIFLFFLFKNKKYGVLSLLNLILVVITNQILKLIFSRPRPFEWMIIEESGYSFPSGHAMVSTAFYGMLIYLIWQTNINKKYKKLWSIILGLLILLICLSRIYLGVHYASDIIAGFTLSLSYLIIATTIIDYYLSLKRAKKTTKQ